MREKSYDKFDTADITMCLGKVEKKSMSLILINNQTP